MSPFWRRKQHAPKNNMDSVSAALATLTLENAIRTPPFKFHLFPLFPSELRFKIWKLACDEPRILELVTDYKAAQKSEDDFSHHYHRVSRISCKVPSILHACKESRREASSIYELRNFAYSVSERSRLKPSLVYFNPNCDTVYFGPGTCMMTMANFFACLHNRNEEVQRVAISCCNSVLGLCNRDPYFPSAHIEGWTDKIINTYTAVELLHGIDKPSEPGHRAPGCPGLREVSWVIPSMLFLLEQGEMNENVCLRPTNSTGLTESQEEWHGKLSEDMGQVTSGAGLQRLTDYKWTGNNIPSFGFMAFSPTPEPGMEFDSVMLPRKDAKFFKGKPRQRVEGDTGVEITVSEQRVIGQEEIEIGLYGTAASISKAKIQIWQIFHD